jgi:hypothetical protein
MVEKHLKEYEEIFCTESDEDFELDEVNGARNKKRKLDLLNKRKISRFEMDELFCEFDQ